MATNIKSAPFVPNQIINLMKTAFRLLTLVTLAAVTSLIAAAQDQNQRPPTINGNRVQKVRREENEKDFTPLFNGKDTTGWKLRHADGRNSWTVEPGGILKNTVEKGGPHGTDLMT